MKLALVDVFDEIYNGTGKKEVGSVTIDLLITTWHATENAEPSLVMVAWRDGDRLTNMVSHYVQRGGSTKAGAN